MQISNGRGLIPNTGVRVLLDREVLEVLGPDPELLAIADAIAATLTQGRQRCHGATNPWFGLASRARALLTAVRRSLPR